MKRATTIKVATSAGTLCVEVPAVYGIWAYHLALPSSSGIYPGRWTVTHVPSGWACAYCDTKAEADALARALRRVAPAATFAQLRDPSSPETATVQRTIEARGATIARYHATSPEPKP